MKTQGKREFLVKAAVDRFHRYGLPASSIADVASDAGIPPGNVYYYFRTKDALAVAVHEDWQERIVNLLDDIEGRQRDPARRVIDFLERSERNAPSYARSGCPLAALSRDFRNGSPTLRSLAGDIFSTQLKWLEKQFGEIGLPRRDAVSAALAMVTAVQGGIALAYATNSPAPIRASTSDAKRRVSALSAAFR